MYLENLDLIVHVIKIKLSLSSITQRLEKESRIEGFYLMK